MALFSNEDVSAPIPSNIPYPEIVAYLITIVKAYQSPGISYCKACDVVAKRLRTYSSSNRQWSGRYIRQVIGRTLSPSRQLALAVRFEIAKIEKWNNFEVQLEKVTVLAPIGRVPPNTLLCLHPKICPKCGCAFFGNSPRQVVCNYCRYQKEHKVIVINE
jgi:hypothetical protein